MEHTGKLLILAFFSLFLILVPQKLAAQEPGTTLPIMVIGMRVADTVIPVILRPDAQQVSPNPLSVGLVLRQDDVVDLRGNGELILSCGDGHILTVESNELRSVTECNEDYAPSPLASVFSWEGFTVHELPRSTVSPEIIYPGNTVLSQPPTQIEWYFDTRSFIGEVDFTVDVLADFMMILPAINKSGSENLVLEITEDIYRTDLTLPDINLAYSSLQIQIEVTGERGFDNNNTRSLEASQIVSFCVRERIEPPAIISSEIPTWLDTNALLFTQALSLFESSYHAEALDILLNMTPPILPEQLPANYHEIDALSNVRSLANRQLLTSSPTYYILLGDVYNNLGVQSFAMRSYDIGEALARELQDNLSIASILFRRAENLRNVDGDIADEVNIASLYDESARLFEILGYPDESQHVVDFKNSTVSRTPPDLC